MGEQRPFLLLHHGPDIDMHVRLVAAPEPELGDLVRLEAVREQLRERQAVAGAREDRVDGRIAGEARPTGEDLFAAAKAGDRLCEAEIRRGGHLLGLAFGGLVNILNPDLVTLSGGLLGMGEMLLGPMRESMYSIAYGPASGTIVKTSELGDDAGLLGAAAVGFERLADAGR